MLCVYNLEEHREHIIFLSRNKEFSVSLVLKEVLCSREQRVFRRV